MWCSPPCLVNTLLSGSVLVYTPRCTALRAQLYLCGSAPLRGSLYTCRSAQCATKHAAPHVSARLSALHISALLCAPHCNKTVRRQRSLRPQYRAHYPVPARLCGLRHCARPSRGSAPLSARPPRGFSRLCTHLCTSLLLYMAQLLCLTLSQPLCPTVPLTLCQRHARRPFCRCPLDGNDLELNGLLFAGPEFGSPAHRWQEAASGALAIILPFSIDSADRLRARCHTRARHHINNVCESRFWVLVTAPY